MTPTRRCSCGACRRCWLWEDPGPLGQAYRDSLTPGRVARPAAPARGSSPAPADRPPCAHAGEPLTPAAAARLSLGTVRSYFACARGHGQRGYVCHCFTAPLGCAGCPDYTPRLAPAD